MDLQTRPWEVQGDHENLFSKWLSERGGIVVYENHVLDSSRLGDRTFLPARFIGEDDQMHEAPEEYRPNGGVPSQRQTKVDHIRLDEFNGDINKALSCFTFLKE